MSLIRVSVLCFVALALFAAADALKCYHCEGFATSTCGWPFGGENVTEDSMSKFLIDCEDKASRRQVGATEDEVTLGCFKTAEKLGQSKTLFYMRGCLYGEKEDDKDKKEEGKEEDECVAEPVKMSKCVCDEDNCNAADTATVSAVAVVVSVLAARLQ